MSLYAMSSYQSKEYDYQLIKEQSKTDVELSIIVPLFNEAAVVEQFHRRLTCVLDAMSTGSEIIYIDDGSSDETWRKLQLLSQNTSEQALIRLSRNFGKEAAMSAGIEAARGSAVILIDSDLQDPPELIPDMVDMWRKGYDIINMRRRERHGESWLKKTSAAVFYRLLNRLSDIPIPGNVGDFRLLSRRVVDHINALPEKTRYMKGLFSWPGFRQKVLFFDRDPRAAGETKWNYLKLLGLAFEGITSFSIQPLRLASWGGFLTATLAVLYALVIVFQALTLGIAPPGYASLMVATLFLGGVQLLAIGLLGEYVGRIFIETKQRPLYLVMKKSIKPASRRLTGVAS
ncbi:glycosyltransferase family 2 protein [Endozoicomonas sp. GU-1]|uniref:glycosyltransferase family 2 protein n=1 Tax=Endozoicomonas sp. GU-1 TaxID=3009078 RepID=UPI0022B4879D|nr:glycosyltransferase family 2 protein [Endozoicomonas sp. GU-1]WBA82393.1 glycosyltransferase family 2 protein [Endozoicomonas sp. GU-1]WBA85328.1 glycosyltransferase family 2 protein [Endozoicomonas sp. GU-1]